MLSLNSIHSDRNLYLPLFIYFFIFFFSPGNDDQLSMTPKTTSVGGMSGDSENTNSPAGGMNNNQLPRAKSCAGCGSKIVDKFLLFAMERYWHTGCLKCACCQAPLGEIGSSCFTKAGMILCRNDYIR